MERELGLKRCEVVWFLSIVQINFFLKNLSTRGLEINSQWFKNCVKHGFSATLLYIKHYLYIKYTYSLYVIKIKLKIFILNIKIL